MTKKQQRRLYLIAMFVGIIFVNWQVYIFQDTFILIKTLIKIGIMASCSAFIIDFNHYKRTFELPPGIQSIIYGTMQYILSVGFIITSLFMLINYYFADASTVKIAYPIIERSVIIGPENDLTKNKPMFYINYKDTKKEFIFPKRYNTSRGTYKTIEFDIKHGFFGFDVVAHKNLK